MNHNFQNTLLIAICVTVGFASCKKTEVDDLQEAQLCLNSASASTARGCVSSISALSSPRANSLKCSAIFISEGFGSPTAFIAALDSINQGGTCTGGCSSTVNALTTFAFSSFDVSTGTGRDANNATAAEAFNVCAASSVSSYTQISSLFKLGTLASMVAYSLTGGAAIDIDDIDSALASLASSDPSTVGNIAITTYSAVCSDPEHASDSTVAYCNELKTAVESGSTATDIGSCLLNRLSNTAYVCPQAFFQKLKPTLAA